MNSNISAAVNNSLETQLGSEREIEEFENDRNIYTNAIIFICITVFVAIFFRQTLKKNPLPFESLVFLFGMALGFVIHLDYFKDNHRRFSNIDYQIIMYMCMPPIMYEFAFSLDPNMFTMALVPCLLLAVPGLATSIIANSVFAKYMFFSSKWSWNAAVMFGSAVCATTPSAVMIYLKDGGFSGNLGILLSGEALLNNAGSHIVFDIMIDGFIYGYTAWEAVRNIFYQIAVTLAVSYLISVGAIILLRKVELEKDIEVTSVLCIVYITYYLNEVTLESSGILSVIVLGICISNYKNNSRYDDMSDSTVHQVWQTMSFWATTLIFTLVGMIVASKIDFHNIKINEVAHTFLGYIAVLVIRFIMVKVFSFRTFTPGYEVKTRDAIVMTWTSVRGAVGLGMAVLAHQKLPIQYGDSVLKITSGIIVLGLVVNGSTTKILLKLLGYGRVSETSIKNMDYAVSLLRDSVIMSEKLIRTNKYFVGVDWMWVRGITFFQNPYQKPQDIHTVHATDEQKSRKYPHGAIFRDEKDINTKEKGEIEEDSRIHVINTLKGSVRQQHDSWGISRRTLHFLSNSLEIIASERGKQFLSEELIEKYTRTWKVIRFLRKYLGKAIETFNVVDKKVEKERFFAKYGPIPPSFRLNCINSYFNKRIDLFIYCILLLNLMTLVNGIYIVGAWDDKNTFLKKEFFGFEILNAVLSFFYLTNFYIKITALHCREYFKSHGNKVDFFVTLLNMIETILFIVVTVKYSIKDFSYKLVLTLVVLNSFTLIRLFRLTFIGLVANLRNEVSSGIYNAYDLAIGFISANMEIVKTSSRIIQYETCADLARFTAENNIIQMMAYIDDLECEFPDVTNAWMTQRAIIYVLRYMRAIVRELADSHMIDESDFELLSENITWKIKDTLSSPKFMVCVKDHKKILKTFPWVKNEEMLEFLMVKKQIVRFYSGDSIQEQDRKHKDVRIILSGVIEVMGINDGEKNNILPNTDSLEYFTREGPFCDYLVSPNETGILGFLLKKKSATSATCSKDCELIQISYETLEEAEKLFKDFSFDMWRPIALKIAECVLREQEIYEYWTEEELKIYLEGGIFVNLQSLESYFEIYEQSITDKVLVQGRVQDAEAETVYIGPAYIPSHVRNFKLLDGLGRPRIVLVLFREKSYHSCSIMGWIEPSDIKLKALCLVHGMRRRNTLDEEQKRIIQGRQKSSFGNLIRQLFSEDDENEEIMVPDLPFFHE